MIVIVNVRRKKILIMHYIQVSIFIQVCPFCHSYMDNLSKINQVTEDTVTFNPLIQGGAVRPPPCGFCPLLFFDKFCLHPLAALLGHPVQKYF